MTDADTDMWERVRELRTRGCSPKVIARTLGMSPAEVAPLIQALAADAAAQTEAPGTGAELVGCWVSRGWSDELIVPPRPEWPDADAPEGTTGLVGVLVARGAPRRRVSVCRYLVDTQCLGVKNALGPEVMSERRLPGFTRDFFDSFLAPPLSAPLELAQHLVYGALDYARGLGFEPHPDFAAAEGHLGTWTGPSAITFGRQGTPVYISGPYDDPRAVLRTLDHTVGKGNYHYLVGAG